MGTVLRQLIPASSEIVLDEHQVGDLPGGSACRGGLAGQRLPAMTLEVLRLWHAAGTGCDDGQAQVLGLLGSPVEDVDKRTHRDGLSCPDSPAPTSLVPWPLLLGLDECGLQRGALRQSSSARASGVMLAASRIKRVEISRMLSFSLK